jgi:hypothetical protein
MKNAHGISMNALYTRNMNTDNSSDTATKQAVNGHDEQGRFTVGNVPNTGFHTNPERRSNGSWTKENTARGKLEALLNTMTLGEFKEQLERNKTDNDQKLGDTLLSGLLDSVMVRKDGGIAVDFDKTIRLLEFIYGRKTEGDTTLHDDGVTPIIKGFVIPTYRLKCLWR